MAVRWSKGSASSAVADPRRQFLPIERPVGRARLALFGHVAVLLDVLIERHLLAAVPPVPPALAVPGLVDDDAEDPGAEGGLAAEGLDGAEDAQEHLLRGFEGLVGVAEQVEREVIDHALVLRHEVGAGELVARRAALDQRGLAACGFSPTICARRLEHQVLGHVRPLHSSTTVHDAAVYT